MSSIRYYPYFDWLRFALALVVVLYHDKLIYWEDAGDLAVQVFFALSGWLIAGILLNIEKNDLQRFYYNRILRIWIPYYLALALILAIGLFKDELNSKWFEFVLYKIFFVYNLFGVRQLAEFRQFMPLGGTAMHFWTVNAEEQFYLISPIFIVVLAYRNIIAWSILAITLLYFNQYASISFGVVAAIINYKYPGFHLNNKSKIIFSSILFLATILLISNFTYHLVAPFFAISLVMLLAKCGKQNKIAGFFGGLSYPLYLNHWIGVFAANFLFTPFGLRESIIRKIVATIVSIIFAAFHYQMIDKRIQRLRDKYYKPQYGYYCMLVSYLSIIIGILIGLVLFPIEFS